MKSLFLSLIIFIIFVLSGCDSVTGPEGNIYGNWNWVKSTGGFGGGTLTPEIAGYTRKVVFSRGNVAAFYLNDSLEWTSRFTIGKEQSGFFGDDKEIDVIRYDNSAISQAMLLRNDTLRLADYNIMDGFINTYVKIK